MPTPTRDDNWFRTTGLATGVAKHGRILDCTPCSGRPQRRYFTFTVQAGELRVWAAANSGTAVDWGDGSPVELIPDSSSTTGLVHVYAGPATGTIWEPESFHGLIVFGPALVSVDDWGDSPFFEDPYWGSFSTSRNVNDGGGWAEVTSPNLTSVPDTLPPGATSTSGMFYGAEAFNQDISGWDMSSVTDTSFMFAGTSFNQDVGGWDMSNVTNISGMFRDNPAFNQDIGGWDTSKVTRMDAVFHTATAFNQDIGGWDTSNVDSFYSMFRNSPVFNQDISGWDTSSATYMHTMFYNTAVFNQDISGWDVSKVSAVDGSPNSMQSMLGSALSFNQDLSGWCVTKQPVKPNNFDGGSLAWVLPRPVWGTCP